MNLKFIISFLVAIILFGCKKNAASISSNADDIFWVTNTGADMPVWVKGNTASKTFILVVHGGPGEGAYNFADDETARLRTRYAVAYWDQRNAGSASGNNNYASLSLDQMVNDLQAVVKVMKYRYGNDISIFLYGHSFGGLLGAAYLVAGNNQYEMKGWIDFDGAHNYPLTNSLSKKMLIDTGTSEIRKGRNVNAWTTIVNYCKTHNPNKSFNASSQIEEYAHDAQVYMGVNEQGATVSLFSPEDPMALLANWFKMFNTHVGDEFTQSLQEDRYSRQLGKVKIPVLLLWGQYDFTVPSGVGENAKKNLGSDYKRFVIFPNSGHRPMQSNTDSAENEIIRFVDRFK
jgi:pimeloyl-ACP methyl ester carboxylesterase